MRDYEKHKVDQLLSDIADGGDRNAAAELNELLLDRPELQRYYAMSITVLALLRLESLQSSTRTSAVEDLRASVDSLVLPNCTPGSGVPGKFGPLSMRNAWKRSPLRFASLGLAGAAALLLVFVIAPSLVSHRLDKSDQHASSSLALMIDGNAKVVEVRDRQSLRLVGELTRQPRVTNLVLPVCEAAQEHRIALCSGGAWIHRMPHGVERGYLLALPPGCLVKADIDADAAGVNCLAVAEVDASGSTTGESLVFDNSATQTADRDLGGAICVGRIGSFSKSNTSLSTKYYLFTGSHAITGSAADASWRQSDYKIQLDAENVLVIGWDDSGYAAAEESAINNAPDRDFNDIRVVLRFAYPDSLGSHPVALSRYLPEPNSDQDSLRTRTGIGHAFEVAPGAEVLISASSDALYRNSLRVVELGAASPRTIWRHDGFAEGSGLRRRVPSDLGVYLIRNTSKNVHRYEIQGLHKRSIGNDNTPWSPSSFRLLDSDERSRVVGFEDSADVQENVDWRDLRVYVRFFSQSGGPSRTKR